MQRIKETDKNLLICKKIGTFIPIYINARVYYETVINCRRSFPTFSAKIPRWRIAPGGLAVNQQRGATDSGIFNGRFLHPLAAFSRPGKRRRLIRGRRHFCEEVSFLRRQCRGISRKLQKGESGQRVRERWNKEQITGPSKNTGRRIRASTLRSFQAKTFVLGEKNYLSKAVFLYTTRESLTLAFRPNENTPTIQLSLTLEKIYGIM